MFAIVPKEHPMHDQMSKFSFSVTPIEPKMLDNTGQSGTNTEKLFANLSFEYSKLTDNQKNSNSAD